MPGRDPIGKTPAAVRPYVSQANHRWYFAQAMPRQFYSGLPTQNVSGAHAGIASCIPLFVWYNLQGFLLPDPDHFPLDAAQEFWVTQSTWPTWYVVPHSLLRIGAFYGQRNQEDLTPGNNSIYMLDTGIKVEVEIEFSKSQANLKVK